MCDNIDFYAYDGKSIVTYSKGKLVDKIDKIYGIYENNPALYSNMLLLPNSRYIFQYSTKFSVGNTFQIGKLGEKELTFKYDVGLSIWNKSPADDGSFIGIFDDKYYHINDDNSIDVIDIPGKYDKVIIPANIRDNFSDSKAIIDSLLKINNYKVNPTVNISIITHGKFNKLILDTIKCPILAWFDNKYIVQYNPETNMTIIYNIKNPVFSIHEERIYELLKTEIFVTAEIVKTLSNKDIGLPDKVKYQYTHANKDNSIDIYYLTDYNISILHFTSRREIEVDEYDIKKLMEANEIDFKSVLYSLTADDYGFAIQDKNKTYYYVDKATKCIKLLGKFESLAISHEGTKRNKEISEANLGEYINPNLRNIISEYD